IPQAAESAVLVMAAAVADYKVATGSSRKIKKRDTGFALELIPTRHILAAMGKKDRNFLLVGFAAETENLEENARKKLRQNNLDLVVAKKGSAPRFGVEDD